MPNTINGSNHSSSSSSSSMKGDGGGTMHPLELDDDRDGILINSMPEGGGARACAGCRTFTITTFNIFHPLCTLALALAVTALGLQLRAVQQQVAADGVAIAALREEIAEDQATQQDLGERVEQEHSLTLYQMAGTFTLLTCLITTLHIAQHLSNFHEAVVQRKILAILWMSPIYSVTSFLSLIFPSSNQYLAVIKDFYEAYVIYTFLSFLIAVLGRGNRETAVSVLACHAEHLHPPANCLRHFYHPPPETDDKAKASAVLMECQILAMQFVLVRPVTSILQFIAETFIDKEDFSEEDPWAYFKTAGFFISMITNVSVFFAFNGLIKFYHAVHEDLLWCRPFAKFLAIKGIVFLTFWQGLLIEILVNFSYSPSAGTPNEFGSVTTDAPATSPTSDFVSTFSPAMSPLTLAPTTFEQFAEGATNDVGGNRTRFLNGDSGDAGADSETRSAQIQNFLICLEMLFFSLAHYCVFPVEEWAPDYRPKQVYAKPGFGLKDFASDISYIMTSSSEARKYRRSRDELDGASVAEREDDDDVGSSSRVIELSEANAIDEGRMIPNLPDTSYHREDDDPQQLT